MTTDNRTNGLIVAKALVAHCEDHKMPVPRGSVKKIVEALRVAGRLAGEPTEAEWEYGYTEHGMNPMRGCQDLATARACASAMQEEVVRRRMAGPWLPLEGEIK